MIVVSDASPLIALARIDRLELLREIFQTLVVPDAVWNEVTAVGVERPGAESVLTANWIERRSICDSVFVARLRLELGAGEAEAIVLARENHADMLLVDEPLARLAAQRLGLRVTGLVGVLIEARRRGLLSDATTIADDLAQKAGFWLSDSLRRLIAEGRRTVDGRNLDCARFMHAPDLMSSELVLSKSWETVRAKQIPNLPL